MENNSPSSAADAEQKADAIRKDLVRTIDQIGENLRPSRIKAKAAETFYDNTPAGLRRYWRFVCTPPGFALTCLLGASIASTMISRRRVARRRR